MATQGNRRATLVAAVGFGLAELRPDPARPAGWELLVGGVAQSYVDLADPTHLEFEYVRRVASVLASVRAPGVPIKVLHLGGGGLTLARFVAATRPGSAQKVVERDGELFALVARILPAPADVEVVVGDAREVLDREEPAAYDVIVSDVFDGAAMPRSVAGESFAAAAARALRPGGLLAMNLTDRPPLASTRIQVATLRTAFAQVCLIAGNAMLGGRKAGNIVLVAGRSPGDPRLDRLALAAERDAEPGRVLAGERLDEFVGGAKPRLDGPR
jgi:SAM-dependent methyltransferase